MQQLILAAIVENTTGSSLTTSTSWFPKRVAGFQSSIALGDQFGNPIELALGGSIGVPFELMLLEINSGFQSSLLLEDQFGWSPRTLRNTLHGTNWLPSWRKPNEGWFCSAWTILSDWPKPLQSDHCGWLHILVSTKKITWPYRSKITRLLKSKIMALLPP